MSSTATKLSTAWLAVEADVMNLVNLTRDLQVHIAELNAHALMAGEPTINWQIFAPDLRGNAEGLFDQLMNVEVEGKEEHRRSTVLYTEDLVEKAVQGITAMIQLSHGASVSCGWWKDPDTGADLGDNPLIFSNKVSLMHSELSEALEADRKDKMDEHLPHRKGVDVEFADTLHRIFDLAGKFGYDLAGAYIEKGYYNLERADHKPGNRQMAGGKRY